MKKNRKLNNQAPSRLAEKQVGTFRACWDRRNEGDAETVLRRAAADMAKADGVQFSTIKDAVTRRIGINTSDMVKMISDWLHGVNHDLEDHMFKTIHPGRYDQDLQCLKKFFSTIKSTT